jgi:ABC-2 type transport system permease protein
LTSFRALVSVAAQEAFMYRGRYVVGVLISLVQITVLYYIWRAVMGNGPNPAGYDWPQMQTYLLLSFLLTLLLSYATEYRVSASVRDGSVSMELLKPVHYMTLRAGELVAALLVELLSVGLCLAIAVLSLLPAVPPRADTRILLFVSFLLAVALKAVIAVATGILGLWTTNVLGLIACRQALALLLSGAMFPLQMLPDWLHTVAYALPFQSSFNTPVMIYFGRVGGWGAAGLVAVQAGWLLVLAGAAAVLLNRGLQRLDSYGG